MPTNFHLTAGHSQTEKPPRSNMKAGGRRDLPASSMQRSEPFRGTDALTTSSAWKDNAYSLKLTPSSSGIGMQLVAVKESECLKLDASVRDAELAEFMLNFVVSFIERRAPDAIVIVDCDPELQFCFARDPNRDHH
jgi:hypothetical protein